jgi:hypothetical protein
MPTECSVNGCRFYGAGYLQSGAGIATGPDCLCPRLRPDSRAPKSGIFTRASGSVLISLLCIIYRQLRLQ